VAYPGRAAGLRARYRAAAALVALGRVPEGIQRYREVVEKGHGAYQAMSRMGIAEGQLMAGKPNEAIAAFKDVEALKSEDVPLDGILMALGRAYRAAGNAEEAKRAFKRVADEFPQSPYALAARREAEGDASPIANR
jgi:hypothetical protein